MKNKRGVNSPPKQIYTPLSPRMKKLGITFLVIGALCWGWVIMGLVRDLPAEPHYIRVPVADTVATQTSIEDSEWFVFHSLYSSPNESLIWCTNRYLRWWQIPDYEVERDELGLTYKPRPYG